MADLGGIPTTAYEYSPADFADAEENSSFTFFNEGHPVPSEISGRGLPLNTVGSEINYSLLLNNTLERHTYEIREKVQTSPMTSNQWRRRFREFLTHRVKDLLEFAAKPLAKHPTLGPTEILLRKFGKPNFVANHHTLRDVALDSSGVNIIGLIEEGLKQFPHTLKGFQEQTRYLFDMYRESADEIVRQDTILQSRLLTFDKVQIRVMALAELQVNAEYETMAAAAEAYLKRIFEENTLEPLYKALIEAYRKFLLLRDVVHLRRLGDSIEAQPLCNICFEESIQFAVTPCGHTYCSTCVRKQFTTCYVCRGAVKDRVKLFLG
jgi:hypothetical protein